MGGVPMRTATRQLEQAKVGLTAISEEQELLGILTRQSYPSPGFRTGLWLQSTEQFSEECLKNILHGVSVQHDTPTFHESVLAGPAPRATYHMHMREGAAPAVAGDSVAVWRDAVRSDEDARPECSRRGGMRQARESLGNVQRTY